MCISQINLPITKTHLHGYKTQKVPCGHCHECQKEKAAGWVFRIQEEIKANPHTKPLFITLTYNEENIPYTGNLGLPTLHKQDFQNFIKRLRNYEKRNSKNPNKIIYYGCGEYGTINNRPHYHLILINISDEKNIERAWSINDKQIGIIHYGSAETASIAYTAKYLQKNQVHSHIRRIARILSVQLKSQNINLDKSTFNKYVEYQISETDDRQKEFSLMSKSIGKSFLTKNMINHYIQTNKQYVRTPDNKKIMLPIYYRNKIYTREQILKNSTKKMYEKEKNHEEKRKAYEKDNNKSYIQLTEETKLRKAVKYNQDSKKMRNKL